MLVYGKYECFVMQMYVCVLCASCGSSQCCILHDLQFVNAGRGCKRRPYGRGILQSRSHDCLIGCVLNVSGYVRKKALLQCLQLLRGGIWACMRCPVSFLVVGESPSVLL